MGKVWSSPRRRGNVVTGKRRRLALRLWKSLVGVVSLAMLASVMSVIALVASPAPLAEAAPGDPGNPSAPKVLYTEDFQNGSGVTELENYNSTQGVNYTADPYWRDAYHCNGFILGFTEAQPSTYCDDLVLEWQSVQAKAYALGLLHNPQDATTNRALSTNTTWATTPNTFGITPNQVEFATSGQLNLPAASGRFITFSVNAAATSCAASPPLLRFYLRTGSGQEVPVSSSAINPCGPGSQSVTVPGISRPVNYGSFPANGATLLTGSSLGIVLRNESGTASGNDGAIDDI
jgi:hypothetical protein